MLRRLPLFAAFLLALSLGCAGSDAQSDQTTIELDQGDPGEGESGETGETGEAGEGNEAGGGENLVIGEDACEPDDDCVPAECCHAAACVAAANAPDCTDVMCTMDCQYGTLDCGGRCLCHEGRCAARLSEPPAGLPTE